MGKDCDRVKNLLWEVDMSCNWSSRFGWTYFEFSNHGNRYTYEVFDGMIANDIRTMAEHRIGSAWGIAKKCGKLIKKNGVRI